MNSWINE
jgi:cytochrome c553